MGLEDYDTYIKDLHVPNIYQPDQFDLCQGHSSDIYSIEISGMWLKVPITAMSL